MPMRCHDTCCREDYSDDEYIVLSRRYPRATRTTHQCTYCGKQIPAGSPCFVINVLAEGRVTAYYHHRACPEY